MKYHYKCTNIQCEKRNEEIEIEKEMKDSGEPEYCEKCKKNLQRIFGSPGIKTNDNYKG